ncbi:keratin-associated protein 15-1-like [Pteronotus mesoamericanus]|uniref:keratin-associated protein 15-1-like n=1 Tax=Pteronotus mesoamericanus TaxID=1884717 RepID=UPI0023EDBD6B|nr:keratin-associated protein 15-1-like [Pteronotus parnellii mesoamericanus]
MSCSLSSCSRSSRSLGRTSRCPGPSCESFFPGSVVYSPGQCPPGASVYSGCQEAYGAPPSCRAPCLRPRPPAFCSPNAPSYAGYSGCGGAGFGPFGYGGAPAQSLGCGPGGYRPASFSSRTCQAACVPPAFGSRCFGPAH